MQIDHATLRSTDLKATRDFFLSVFPDLREGPRPAAIRRIPGMWLYADHAPVLHLIAAPRQGPPTQGDGWDHVAFRLEDRAGCLDRLDRLGVRWSAMDLPELSEQRIFLHAPGGALVELVFRSQPDPMPPGPSMPATPLLS